MLFSQVVVNFSVRFELKCESEMHMPGLANRLNLFEQLFRHLIRYIDQSKFEHCLSAKL